MSYVRTKRKHVLDSDSDEDDAPGVLSSHGGPATACVSAAVVLKSSKVSSPPHGASPDENAERGNVGGASDVFEDDGGASDGTHGEVKAKLAALAAKAAEASKPKKRLMSAADKEARDAAIVIDDPSPSASADDARDVVVLASDGEEEEEEEEEDQALVRCARISRRLRRALGQDVSDGSGGGGLLSPCPLGDAPQPTGRRVLVTVEDVAGVCGEGSAAWSLKPYQMIGVNFLLLLDEQDVTGAILADEMGLGKTAQTIGYLAYSRHRRALADGSPAAGPPKSSVEGTKNEPVLVVAPASLLENWRRELSRWAPNLRVGFFHGTREQASVRERADEWARVNGGGRAAAGGGAFDVIIACYSAFERDSADQRLQRKWLRCLNYSHLVLDEAHLVKNRSTQRAKRLEEVAAKARRRVLLTGTPLQNNLLELEALIHLVLPGLLEEGALGGDHEEEDEETAALRVARVKFILAPFILRRLKEEVARELVPKQQEKLVMRMTPAQDEVYRHAVEAARSERQRAEGKEERRVMSNSRAKHLFVHLRKIANHPLLIRRRYTDEDVREMSSVCHRRGIFGSEAKIEKVEEHVGSLSDFDLHQLCNDAQLKGALKHKELPVSALMEASKTQRLCSLLEELVARGSRPLIFSQWKIVLDILGDVMREKGYRYMRLDGGTPVEERQQICDAYNRKNSDLFCLLMSTRAGGQGLNLTSADTVIIHDCDFNPQIDRQAEDRCHRLGQTKPVTIYRLVTEGSVDERIVQIAERKLDLDAAILTDDKAMAAEESRAMHSIIEELLA